jgi:hypothetical protein
MSISQEMMDLFRASAIPDGVAWGDYDNDDFSIASTIEREGSVCSSQDWEIVGEKETIQAPIHPRTPRWCKTVMRASGRTVHSATSGVRTTTTGSRLVDALGAAAARSLTRVTASRLKTVAASTITVI